MLNITIPVVTDGNMQTNTESEVVTSFFSDLSLTTKSTESEVVTSFFPDLSLTTKSTEININLPAIYASVGLTMVILIILLSMCIVIIVFFRKCKLKTNTHEDSNSQPNGQTNGVAILTHELESLPVNNNQNEDFDYKENIAYVKVCPVILNENVSYAPTDSQRFAPLYEEIDDSRLNSWHGSIAYRQ